MALRSVTGGMDPYAVLGLERRVTATELRARYRQLAARHHPDRNPDDPQATARMGRINRAYELLSEPASRARVDAELRRGPVASAWRGGAASAGDELDLVQVYAWVTRRMRRASGWQRALLGVGGFALQWLQDSLDGRDERDRR